MGCNARLRDVDRTTAGDAVATPLTGLVPSHDHPSRRSCRGQRPSFGVDRGYFVEKSFT
jgi:hypothetical protein